MQEKTSIHSNAGGVCLSALRDDHEWVLEYRCSDVQRACVESLRIEAGRETEVVCKDRANKVDGNLIHGKVLAQTSEWSCR